MFRSFSFYLRSVLAIALVSSFYIACGGGGDECTSNNDCKTKKGEGYVCQTDGASGKKACVQESNNNNNNGTTNSNNTQGNTNNTQGNTNNTQGNTNNTQGNTNNTQNNTNSTNNNNPVCTKDADCAATEECKNGQCVAKSNKCTSDADCPGGQTCDTSTGVCGATTNGKKLGEECDQQNPCDTGLQCIGNQIWGKFYCFQNCANDAAVCKNGTTCIQASSTISICAKQAAKGEDCDYAGATTQALCQSGQKPPLYCSVNTKKCTEFKLLKEGDACGGSATTDPIGICDSDSNLTCSGGKCVTVKTVGKFEPCGGTTAAQCGATETCVSTSQDSGHCFTKCTVSSPQCGTGETCQALQQGSSDGVCVPSGNLDYGVACGVEPTEKYDPAKLCKQDLQCVNFGRRICIELANGNCQSYQCKMTGATCVDLSAGSSTFAGCFKPCTADTDCTSETFCRDLQTSGKVCWPKSPPGDVTYGGVCKGSAQNRTERCKEPGVCLTTNPESGFCSTECNADGDCAAAPGGSGLTVTCAPISQTSKLCVFDCSASGATCPTGLQCEDIQGSKLCVPPTPVGPNPFQSKCDRNQPIAQAGCAAGLTCFGTSQQSGTGLCSKTCAQNSECTVGGTTASCVKGLFQDPNTGLCVVPCGQPGQTCPTGLTCQTLGSNSICLP